MKIVFFLSAILFIVAGHLLKTIRWKQFADVYEKASVDNLAFSLSVGYLINFCVPFRVGDLIRAYLAGRKMKNGFSFSLATVIWDRFLDVLTVGVLFIILHMMPFDNDLIRESAFFYTGMGIGLILLTVIAFQCSGIIKKIIKKISWIFNEKIELFILLFCWSLISAFKEIVRKVKKGKLLLLTMGMWGCYLCSYTLLASFFSEFIPGYRFVDVFLLLFARGNVDSSSAKQMSSLEGVSAQMGTIMAVYLLLTIVVILVVVQIHKRFSQTESVGERSHYLLPQINPKDRLHFLENYFDGNAKTYIQSYLDMNRDIQIVRDYSAGSKATTMLCMTEEKMFFRKYILGEDAVRLENQAQWILKHQKQLPLPKIYQREYKENESCFYDMEYHASAAGLFSYIHSNPIERSWKVLQEVLDILWEQFYQNALMDEKVKIQEYIENKVIKNISCLRNARELQGIIGYDTISINGKTYRNLVALEKHFSKEHLLEVFKGDLCSVIHGDLTIENIITIEQNEEYPRGFYLIDPNTENVFSSYFLDYAKLLQSIHGGYEFLVNIPSVQISGNRIQLMMNRSVSYDELYEKYRDYLFGKFTKDQVRSIYYHEVIHWLRLMPYKIEKNGKNAVIFYAGLIMVMNDVVDMFENDDVK